MAIENPKTIRILKLVLMLCGNRYYNLPELMKLFRASERTIYRDLDTLSGVGFDLDRNEGRYRIKATTSTRSAIETMKDELDALQLNAGEESTGDFNLNIKKQSQVNEVLLNVKKVWEAISEKRQVLLRDYRSSSSDSISTRTVEPFSFSPEHQSIWAFERKSNMCKQFKVTRLNEVEVLDRPWEHEHKHHLPFTDLFNISGERYIDELELELQLNAYNLLIEEFPGAKEFITERNPYILKVPVAGYEGIGRFVLGLIDSIHVRKSKPFREYLKQKIKDFR